MLWGRARLAVLALCGLGLAWRLSGLAYQSLWRDEVDALRFARRALPDLLSMFAKPGENGPLFYLLLRPWLDAAGQSEFALRLPAALAGVLAIPLTYALACRLLARERAFEEECESFDLSLENVPLVAALLVAINPYLLWYSQEGKMYAVLVVLVLSTHLAFLSAVRRPRWWRWVLYLGLLASAVLTHVLAILLVPLHLAWLVLLWPKRWQPWAGFALTLLLPAIPYFALVGWWQARLFLAPDFQTGHAFVPLGDMAAVLLVGLSHGIATSGNAWLHALVIFLLLAGAVLGARARSSALIVTWLLLPPLLLYAITLQKPLFTDRYLIWIAPAFALLLALGIRALRRVWQPLGWLALAFVLVLGLAAGWRQTRTPIKSDFRAAAAYVSAHRHEGDRLLFLIPYVRHTFEYYAGPTDTWADGPYTNNDNPPEQVADEMSRAVEAAPAVWLIASEEALWDRRGLVRAWLDAHAKATHRASLERVEVVRYQLD